MKTRLYLPRLSKSPKVLVPFLFKALDSQASLDFNLLIYLADSQQDYHRIYVPTKLKELLKASPAFLHCSDLKTTILYYLSELDSTDQQSELKSLKTLATSDDF